MAIKPFFFKLLLVVDVFVLNNFKHFDNLCVLVPLNPPRQKIIVKYIHVSLKHSVSYLYVDNCFVYLSYKILFHPNKI